MAGHNVSIIRGFISCLNGYFYAEDGERLRRVALEKKLTEDKNYSLDKKIYFYNNKGNKRKCGLLASK